MKNLHYYPITVSLWFPITFAITYIWAVNIQDVPSLYPYISDTGTFSPESCVFGQLLNMGSILMAFVIYIRYRQVRYICENHGIDKETRKQNKKSMYLGFAGALGVSIVANFQETNVFVVHLMGAGMAFGIGSIYMVYATKVSYKLYPIIGTKGANTWKAIFTTICAIGYVVTAGTALTSFFLFDGPDMTKWNSSHAGFKYHVVSSITEWITAFSMMAFIATFSNDFKIITLDEPQIFLADNNVIVTQPDVERY